MIPESKLKADCTSEIIKKMVELAEGFEIGYSEIHRCDCVKYKWEVYDLLNFSKLDIIFPLLIHRAFTGASKKYISEFIIGVDHEEEEVYIITKALILLKVFKFSKYQPSSLTPCECACLHCLIEVLG